MRWCTWTAQTPRATPAAAWYATRATARPFIRLQVTLAQPQLPPSPPNPTQPNPPNPNQPLTHPRLREPDQVWHNLAFPDSDATFESPPGFDPAARAVVFASDTDAEIDVDALGFTYQVGLGSIASLYSRSSTLCQIC
jgi:hypothetical protein